MVDARGAGGFRRAVPGPVVDEQPLDTLETRHVARQLRERRADRLRLVVRRDLDDQVRHGR
jgi:hypothetical protein